MKKILTIVLGVLLCFGAIGGSFVLAKHLDENPPTSVENNASEDETDDTNEPTTKLVKVWELCTDEADLTVGDQIVLVASSNERALSITQNTNNRAATKLVKEDDSITITEDVQVITLEEGVVENTFAFYVETGYLYAASTVSNHLKTKSVLDTNGSWSIDIGEDSTANIVAQGENIVNVLQYNSNNHIFSCYTSTQEAVLIYKLVEREIEL